MRYDHVKRGVDIVTAAFLLLLSLPLLAAVAVVVRSAIGRPVLFRQVRPGMAGRPFTLVKFRTMRDVDERRGLLSDAQRLTPAGRVLRALSLDELPTLWNVLRGEMSLVGPRPLLMDYLRRYTAEQWRRHEVRPGITGLAQISGRNALPWADKFALDTWYVDHRSLALDLWILVRTVPVVLTGTGVRAPGCATAPEYAGPPAGRAEEHA
ncbi:sugar transferase [Phytohabitans sp. ZYX-F-186]|uniref:Sugar transferase n=1 Tax=Phytohabitans maris TaxID=3071409 RepID=A0ABU0ZNI4_9ACTN|nr:sugar transferase [Phytohabitans sp. ZYX-F-186]MDQ7908226.1 sugar transferase [Phytohabitans sp. ZYX-F-186]